MKNKILRVFILSFSFLCFRSNIYSQQGTGLVDVKYTETIISVGGANADIAGYTNYAIQIALDAVKIRGGGTVKLNPGVFTIMAPIRLYSNITLLGSGRETILKKCDGFITSFTIDADWGMLKATVNDASGFRKGMGIELYDSIYHEGYDVTTAFITDIKDKVIFFDNRTICDYKVINNGVISNGCSVIEAVESENVKIANLAIEGRKDVNYYIDGCRGGGVYIFKSRNCTLENVKVNEFNGDSFSWQITENITVRGCEASNGNGHGFHPGTGSIHSVIENCISHNNTKEGILLCWRVQNLIFRNNKIYSNSENGISIGHQDTDNIFENNSIYENGYHGILFRDENEQNSGHRNTFTNNIIENNGMKQEASGFFISGSTHDITISNNIIRSTGKGNQTTAILVGPACSKITATGNTISEFKK